MNLPPSTSERNRPLLKVAIDKIVGQTPTLIQDSVVIEEPLEIQLSYGRTNPPAVKSITVTMRTPGNASELAAGFLLTEGVIRDAADVVNIYNPMETAPDDEPMESAP